MKAGDSVIEMEDMTLLPEKAKKRSKSVVIPVSKNDRQLKMSCSMFIRVMSLLCFNTGIHRDINRKWVCPKAGLQYLGWWLLATSMVGGYCVLNYYLVDGTALFSEIIYNYAGYGDEDFDLMEQAQADFIKNTWQLCLWLTGTAFLYSLFMTCSHHIAELNRGFITKYIHERYMYRNVYYDCSNANRELDNMDARFYQDVKAFGWHFVNCLFGNIYYTGILPVIGSTIGFVYLILQNPAGWIGLVIAVVSFIVFAIINFLLSKWVASATYRVNIMGNNFQRKHGLVITHAETIAFYKGGPEEKAKLEQGFEATSKAISTYSFRLFFLNYSTNFFYWFSTIFNYALPGIIFFLTDTFGDKLPATMNLVVTLTTYNYYLQSTLTYSIYCSESFSLSLAHGTRVLEAISFIDRCYEASAETAKQTNYEASDHVEVENVTCKTPFDQLLVSDLTFRCGPYDSLLIRGPSGTGKSSILRIICGLWPAKTGNIKCVDKQTFFMPQKPYLTIGTLREQFKYPDVDGAPLTDQELFDLLNKVDLAYVLDRYNPDSVEEWANCLSGGEQQRVGMARLLRSKPLFAVLDECTSAVDGKMEAKFYEQLKAMGVVFISVAHRPAVSTFHECILELTGNQSYKFFRNPDIGKSAATDHVNDQ